MPDKERKDDIRIVNCHTHTFTLDHVPSRFLPFGLTDLLRHMPFQKTFSKFLRLLRPFNPRDTLSRYANFLDIGAFATQADVYGKLCSYYPSNTRFVVLPMDMAFMGAGKPRIDLHTQHRELADLAVKSDGSLLPFIAVDPRRASEEGEDLVAMIETLVGMKHGEGTRIFRGVKLYPPLGYLPTDPALKDVYAYCAANDLPVMTHCSRGGVKSKRLQPEEAASYADPDHYREILETWPDLRLCLAHFGGMGDWQKYFSESESRKEVPLDAPAKARQRMNWLTKTKQMIESGRYPNLYTDISYTVFFVEKYMPALKVFLSDTDNPLYRRTLFGSDFYMAEAEVFEEKYLSMKLRAELGEERYRQIACTNPLVYLGEPVVTAGG